MTIIITTITTTTMMATAAEKTTTTTTTTTTTATATAATAAAIEQKDNTSCFSPLPILFPPRPPSSPPSTIKSHWNFTSVFNPEITNVQQIYYTLYEAFLYQSNFKRYTTEIEQKTLDNDKLYKFKLELEKMDRLYHIFCLTDCATCIREKLKENENYYTGKIVQLVARINNYDDEEEYRPLYVLLVFNSMVWTTGQFSGKIFLTRDKKSMIEEVENKEIKKYISSFQTHRNFHSYVSFISSAQELQTKICDIYDSLLTTSAAFRRVVLTPPAKNGNSSDGDDEEKDSSKLRKVAIDVELIDRLYSFNVEKENYEIVARMDYKNQPLFVKVIASVNKEEDGKNDITGTIFLSKNHQLFLDSDRVVKDEKVRDLIWNDVVP